MSSSGPLFYRKKYSETLQQECMPDWVVLLSGSRILWAAERKQQSPVGKPAKLSYWSHNLNMYKIV